MWKHSIILKKDKIDTVAIGGFDGIHIAHQTLIKKTGKNGAVVIIDKDYANITPDIYRCIYVDKPCIFIDLFKIRNLNGKEFIELLKNEFPNLKKIIVGYDFRFGKNRANYAKDLKNLFDGEVEIIKEIKIDGISVHSKTIRELIKKGDLKTANKLLGRDYSIFGKVIKGLGIGRKKLYPTINLSNSSFLLPKEGVYATFSKINENLYPSVTFIGKRETIDNSFSIETHILKENFNEKDFKTVEIIFKEYLRENRKFESLEDLKRQISKDIKKTKEILN